MPFWRKIDDELATRRGDGIGLVAIAERVAASRGCEPVVWLRIGQARTPVYLGSLN